MDGTTTPEGSEGAGAPAALPQEVRSKLRKLERLEKVHEGMYMPFGLPYPLVPLGLPCAMAANAPSLDFIQNFSSRTELLIHELRRSKPLNRRLEKTRLARILRTLRSSLNT